ncbi:MAG TPA: peptide ABC transporter permease [Methyloceanibacter sp.]|nr:peptide ABC transporter permease [Methyloceanibacter sp.]
MNVREAPAQPAPPPASREDPYPAIKARGGEIILTTPTRRAIFFTGLAGAVILALLVTFLALT